MDLHEKTEGLVQTLTRPVDASSLAAFRILFGALMAAQAFYKYFGNIDKHYAPGKLHFTFPLFDWITPWPGFGMQLHMIIMGIAALGIMAGLFYRVSASIFLLTYTYVFLIEQSTYNNHYYLIILLAFLFTMTNANASASVDNLRLNTTGQGCVPYWNVLIFRAQFVIVYFYGGLAKLNSDWLHGEPMRHWLSNRSDYPVVGPFFTEEWCVYFFTYGGLLFDLLIGFMLLSKRTRLIALVPFFFFHLMNKWMFTIGIFPVLAMAAVVLFFEPAAPRRWLRLIGADVADAKLDPRPSLVGKRRTALLTFLGVYLFVQCLVPLRHFLYDGNVSWNEAGHTFAWHMKLRDKKSRGVFTVIDAESGETWTVDEKKQRIHMSSTQRKRMLVRPQMIVQYARFLRENYRNLGVQNPIVHAQIEASLNGRPFRPLIDPEANLAELDYTLFRTPAWVLPLERGLPVGIYPKN
jgi:hypothetical protein